MAELVCGLINPPNALIPRHATCYKPCVALKLWAQQRTPLERRQSLVPLRRHGLPLAVRRATRLCGALQPRLHATAWIKVKAG